MQKILSLFSFLTLLGRGPVTESNPAQLIKNEVLALSLKVIFGLILLSLIIFSSIQFLHAFQIHLSQFQGSNSLELLSFGLIIISAISLLCFIFYRKKVIAVAPKMDLELILLSFAKGVMEGVKREKKEEVF